MAYPSYYYDPSESNAAYDENTLAGCVGGGEGYEKVDSYEANSVYLAVAIPNGAVITGVAVSFQYKQLTWQNAAGLLYSSKLNWAPVLLKGVTLSGSKITSLGTVTTLSGKSQVASGIGAKNSYVSKSLSASMNASVPGSGTNLVGVEFEIDSDNVSDVHFYFKSVDITVTYTVPHTHSYTSAVTKQPGCTAAGVRTYTCSCGASYTEAIPANGHTWVSANCTTPKKCSVCGATEGSALGHSYESVITKPTESSAGYTTHTCTRCGHSYVDSYTYLPEITGIEMIYGGKQISETNKVPAGEKFIISVAVT